MAAMTACKCVGQIGSTSYSSMIGGVTRFKGLVSPLNSTTYPPSAIRSSLFSQWMQISQLVKSNGKRLFLVDTLALVRRLEAEGLPSKQAEAITAAITEVLNDSLENVSLSVVSKAEMQKSEMTQESNLSKLKSEVRSSQSHHFSLLQHENEKLRNDIENMRSELRYEIDKVTAGQRLDLNLERGGIRDELSNQNAETSILTSKLDREIHALKAHLEAAKYELIKYCIGTLVSVSAVGLAVVRILM
ncbi:protein FMP32, mitochondrial-like [Durio zibethinus]|uniref:Protein FMP32, mitochondrial-like n=1 Tax=Durio zibethinus TaxID=66656 RepID=A0A6P6BA85_DURZI|nr:protein FMP32, mitochondrial-like [Durio zibethinus]